jgi:phospholipid/cholesterol/gamma-HCH transport system substrate-binding protein
MEKQAPTPARLLTMTVFALSCFGLLLFLWISFGGNVPLQPKGYRFSADFPQAVSLSLQADVRISGVNVGKVVVLDRGTGRTRATMELDPKYVPLPADSKAMLRSKTLLGETYVALSPGNRNGPKITDGGHLPSRNVRAQIELDEVLRAFDRPTRTALHQWISRMDRAFAGRSTDLNDALGNLGPTAESGADVLTVLDSQSAAVRHLIGDTGKVFGAIGSREGDVQGLIRAGDKLFAATGARNRELSQTIAALPPLLEQSRRTLRTAQAAAGEAAPVIREFRSVAPLVKPTLTDASALAPDAERLFRRTDPVITQSRTGLPAATKLLKDARPLVDALLPVALDLPPVVRYLYSMRDQVLAAQANTAAVLNAVAPSQGGDPLHYLRAITYFSPEGFVGFPQRFASNRRNPYLKNRGLDDLKPGSAIKTSDCNNLKNPQPIPSPEPPPPCNPQGPYGAEWGGGAFPHLTREAPTP